MFAETSPLTAIQDVAG